MPGEGQPPVERWLPLIRRVLDAGKLCQVSVGAQGALDLVGELGGRGLALVITDSLVPSEGARLMHRLAHAAGKGDRKMP